MAGEHPFMRSMYSAHVKKALCVGQCTQGCCGDGRIMGTAAVRFLSPFVFIGQGNGGAED